MNNFQCQYCDNPCQKGIISNSVIATVIEMWSCLHCPHKITYSFGITSDPILTMKVLYYKQYSVHFLFPQNRCVINKVTKYEVIDDSHQRYPLNKESYVEISTPIVDLNIIPDITPQNIHLKLPIYLTFS